MRNKKLLPYLMLCGIICFFTQTTSAQVSKSHKAKDHKEKTESKPSSRSNNSDGGSGPFSEGTLAVDLGAGFWGNYSYNYWNDGYWGGWNWDGWNGTHGWYGRAANSVILPSFHLMVDYGVKKAGPGTFGIGGTLAIKYASWSLAIPEPTDRDFNYFGSYVPYRNSWTDIIVGLRGTYHLNLPKAPKFDLYAGVMLGARIVQYHYEIYQVINWGTSPYTYTQISSNATRTYPVGGLFIGCKYYFTPSFGVFGELGWDVAAVKLGVSFKM